MISVIVPVYNTEKYLKRCIDSILSQTFIDFELLLIDDGSTDSSGTICDEYALKDVRIRVFHKENGGASSARNLGLDNAQGDWITFCDSDDFVYSDWLSNFDVDKNGRKYDIICQGIECSKKFIETHNSNKYLFDFDGTITVGLLSLYEHFIVGYTVIKLFNREKIEQNNLRFDLKYNLREDEEFVLRYLNCCETMISVSKVGYYYFVPDWTNKYRVRNEYDLWLSLYKSAVGLYKNDYNAIIELYLYMLTDKLYDSFLEIGYRQRVYRVKNYRRNVNANIFKTRIFFLIKYLILIDSMGIFSSLFLSLYLKLKCLKSQ